jgi:hypothetical protein
MLVEARDTALRIARLPSTPNEPRAFQQARAAADRLAADLSARVPSIRVVVRGVPADAVTLQFDNAVIPKAAAGMPRKVNPGKHVVAASADGYERASAEIVIEERESRDIDLSLAPAKDGSTSVRKADAAARDERAAAVAGPPLDVEDREPPSRRTNPLVYVGGAVGAAGLVVGTIAGIAELSHTSKAEAECRAGGQRDACGAELDSAHRLATISNVSFGIAALGAATAVFAFVREPSKPARGTAFNLLLVVQPSAASVAGTF